MTGADEDDRIERAKSADHDKRMGQIREKDVGSSTPTELANTSSPGVQNDNRKLPRKLNVGCGYDKRYCYVNVDIDPSCEPDVLIKDHDLSVLPKGHFEEVLANDVLEHIPRNFTMHALLDWAALLRSSGLLMLRTTSILGVAEVMQAHPTFEFQFNWTSCLFGNQQHSGDFHYTGFTERTLRVHLACAGFEVRSLNLRDGWLFETCAVKAWDWTDLIRRSEGNDDTQFLIAAYQEFFDRELDDVGRLHWGGQLRTGHSRYHVLKGIVGSREYLYKRASNLVL